VIIGTRITRVIMLLDKVRKYSDIVTADNFENQSLANMKDNVKDILDEVKDEIDQIKDEVDNW